MTPETIEVGGGRVGLGHRPGRKALPGLADQGFTHVVTLLGEREGAPGLIASIEAAGLTSVWLPLENGEPVSEPDRLATINSTFELIAGELAVGAQLFVHCSAGIHRTGMVVNALLIFLGYEPARARELLGRLRDVTEAGVTDRRLEWGRQFAPSDP